MRNPNCWLVTVVGGVQRRRVARCRRMAPIHSASMEAVGARLAAMPAFGKPLMKRVLSFGRSKKDSSAAPTPSAAPAAHGSGGNGSGANDSPGPMTPKPSTRVSDRAPAASEQPAPKKLGNQRRTLSFGRAKRGLNRTEPATAAAPGAASSQAARPAGGAAAPTQHCLPCHAHLW